MLLHTNGTISFSIFKKFPELLCVMSTRVAGDLYIKKLRQAAKVQKFLRQLKIKPEELVSMEQVHGSEIAIVEDAHKSGEVIPAVDGLVTQSPGIFLGVNAADCVPVFLYDPKQKIVAVVHAGWRGTEQGIVANSINQLIKLGVGVRSLFVAIGPHIGGCCYEVSADFAQSFKTKFPSDRVVFQTQNKWHVDLGEANRLSLLELGVLPEHIDAPITCTSCQNDQYFSFRKDSKETFGEMLGVIGIRTV